MSTRSTGLPGRRLRCGIIAAVAPLVTLAACDGPAEPSAADRGPVTTVDRPVGSTAATATTAREPSPMRPSDITDLVRTLMVATPSVTAAMSDLVSIPYEVPTPRGFELETLYFSTDKFSAPPSVYLSLTGPAAGTAADLESFFRTKFVAAGLAEVGHSTSESANGTSTSSTLKWAGAGLGTAEVTTLAEEGIERVELSLVVPADVGRIIDRFGGWADGFPGTTGLTMNGLDIVKISVDPEVDTTVHWVEPGIDRTERLQSLKAGLPFGGFANAHSPHSGDGVVYLDHPEYSEWSRASVNDNAVLVTVEDAR